MRYVIIDPEEGVFLGTHSTPVANGYRVMVLFSRNNVFEITKAVCWKTEREAMRYLSTYIKEGFPKAFVVSIDTDKEYVDVVQLIKSGYNRFTQEMMDAMPMDNTSIHQKFLVDILRESVYSIIE